MMSYEEKLIDAVREHEILYNTSLKSYRNVHLKEKSWREIAKSLQISDDKCKSKWKNLRDTYKKFKRAEKQYGPKRKKWKYLEHLTFLDAIEDPKHQVVENVDQEGFDLRTAFMEWQASPPESSHNALESREPTPVSFNRNSSYRNTSPAKKNTEEYTEFLKVASQYMAPPKEDTTSTHKFYEYVVSRLLSANLTEHQRCTIDAKVMALVNGEILKAEQENEKKPFI